MAIQQLREVGKMKRYKLLKDLPTHKAGDVFYINEYGDLCFDGRQNGQVLEDRGEKLYAKEALDKFPNILKDWFKEIPEEPKTVWDLKDGDIYFVLCDEGSILSCTWCEDHGNCQVERTCGSCFLTKEEAGKELARRKAKVILERDTKGFKPDWKDAGQRKWYIVCESESKSLFTFKRIGDCYGTLCFASQQDAEESIKKHRKEWLTYLGVEE